jgi:hypothetical protein
MVAVIVLAAIVLQGDAIVRLPAYLCDEFFKHSPPSGKRAVADISDHVGMNNGWVVAGFGKEHTRDDGAASAWVAFA